MVDINEKQEPEYVNSFTAVWLKTRKAVRYTIEEKTTGYAMILVLLSGIGGSLVGMQGSGNGENLAGWLILLLAWTVGRFSKCRHHVRGVFGSRQNFQGECKLC